jgi:hypothetical protein
MPRSGCTHCACVSSHLQPAGVSFSCSSGGVLVAKKDLNFVVRSMIITFIISSSALSAVRIYNWGLQGVWCGVFFVFACPLVDDAHVMLTQYPYMLCTLRPC